MPLYQWKVKNKNEKNKIFTISWKNKLIWMTFLQYVCTTFLASLNTKGGKGVNLTPTVFYVCFYSMVGLRLITFINDSERFFLEDFYCKANLFLLFSLLYNNISVRKKISDLTDILNPIWSDQDHLEIIFFRIRSDIWLIWCYFSISLDYKWLRS